MAVSRTTVPKELHERYGLKPKNPFFIVGTWSIAIFIFGLLFLQINSDQQSDAEVRLISWQATSINSVKVKDSDQFDVGFALFKATNTSDVAQFTQTLTTLTSAYAVLTPKCETDASRLLGSHFRPGLLPPAQDSPLFAPWQWNS
jgi:hypothetical protein